jgi:membrane protease YdiL (CAAX protease family)
MYIKYRSIWPGYVSHALVDLCIFGLGAYIVFG